MRKIFTDNIDNKVDTQSAHTGNTLALCGLENAPGDDLFAYMGTGGFEHGAVQAYKVSAASIDFAWKATGREAIPHVDLQEAWNKNASVIVQVKSLTPIKDIWVSKITVGPATGNPSRIKCREILNAREDNTDRNAPVNAMDRIVRLPIHRLMGLGESRAIGRLNVHVKTEDTIRDKHDVQVIAFYITTATSHLDQKQFYAHFAGSQNETRTSEFVD